MPTKSLPAIPKPNLTLPRRLVLRRRSRFDQLFQGARRFSNGHFTILYDSTSTPPFGQVAFLTPKKLGKAAYRNLLRRRIREWYRQEITVRGELVSFDLLILAKPPATQLTWVELQINLRDLFQRLLEKINAHRPNRSGAD